MRAIWTGSISFGLVNIPIKMYSGSRSHHGLDLNMLHEKDHERIRYARICRKDGLEVPYDEIVKGYEYQDGDYVILTDDDFKKADAKKTQSLEIKQFVDESEIDSRYFDKPYYLEPAKNISSEGEQDMAMQLIKQQTHHFIPEDWHDEYTEELEEIIEAKAKGQKPKTHGKAPEETKVQDLMATLKASLGQ
jgi:non-homologous end joining protein Ku